jgi:hypothetical protein
MSNILETPTVDTIQRNTQGVVEEPILKDNPDRFVLFPIAHHDLAIL